MWKRDAYGDVEFTLRMIVNGVDHTSLFRKLFDSKRRGRVFPEGLLPRGTTLTFVPPLSYCTTCSRPATVARVDVLWRSQAGDRLEDRAIDVFHLTVKNRVYGVVREALRVQALNS